MSTEVERWRELGRAVRRARHERKIGSQADLGMLVGVSGKTIGTLEAGRRVSDETLWGLERVLGWAPDTAHSMLATSAPDDCCSNCGAPR